MAEKQNFENLIAWKKAKGVCLFCYKLVKSFPKEEKYGLSDQLRRAAISIPSNIAEGYSRGSGKDACHFFSISIGSIYEVMTQIDIASELNYVSLEEREELFVLCNESLRLINGFKNFRRTKE